MLKKTPDHLNTSNSYIAHVCSGAQSCPTLCDPVGNIACQAPLSMEFSRQEYWSGLPFPSPGDLPHPGVELASPAMQTDSLPLSHQGSPLRYCAEVKNNDSSLETDKKGTSRLTVKMKNPTATVMCSVIQ